MSDAPPQPSDQSAAGAEGTEAPLDFAALAAAIAADGASDLSGLLGREVALEVEAGAPTAREALLEGGTPRHHATLASGAPGVFAHWLVSPEAARAVVALRLGACPEGALDAAARAALEEVLELASSALGRALSARLSESPVLTLASELLEPPLDAEAPLPAGRYRPLRLRLEGAELVLALAGERASEWFGEAEAAIDARPLAVVDPDAESRRAAEALSAALGRAIWTLDPVDLGDASFDELAETGAIVVSWDLGGRSGLDLVEALVRDPRTRALPLAMASPAPTRAQVLAALRHGARSFLQLPWRAEEVAERLLGATAETEPQSEG